MSKSTKFVRQKKIKTALKSSQNRREKPTSFEIKNLAQLLNDGQYKIALSQTDHLLRQYPNSAILHNIKGISDASLQNWDSAVKSYKRALEFKPNYPEAYNNLGFALYVTGRYKEAKKNLRKAIKYEKDYAEAYNNLGNVLYREGRLVEAIKNFSKSIYLEPLFSKAINNKGIILYAQRRYDEAISFYNKAISIEPKFAEPFYNKGNALQKQGKLQDAINCYNEALRLKIDYPEVYNSMGLALKDQGKIVEAIEAYKEALLLRSDYFDAVRNLLKVPVGQLSDELINISRQVIGEHAKKGKEDSKYKFLIANLLRHDLCIKAAFKKFVEANQVVAKEFKNEIYKEEKIRERLLKKINQWKPFTIGSEHKSIKKIFILGPSRSGKSTVERLLAGSENVFPFFEAIKSPKHLFGGNARHTAERCVKLDINDLFYANGIELQNGKYEIVTCTNPHLINFIIQIVEMVPNSYFLFLKRDVDDIAPEIFTTEYFSRNFYSYDPKVIIQYLEFYEEASKLIISKLPNRAMAVAYEGTMLDPNKILKQIGEFVLVDFDKYNNKSQNDTLLVRNEFKNLFQSHLHNH